MLHGNSMKQKHEGRNQRSCLKMNGEIFLVPLCWDESTFHTCHMCHWPQGWPRQPPNATTFLPVQAGSQKPCSSASTQSTFELLVIVMAETPECQHKSIFFSSVELYFTEIFETYWENTSTLKKWMMVVVCILTQLLSILLVSAWISESKSEIHQHWQHTTAFSQEMNTSDHKQKELWYWH